MEQLVYTSFTSQDRYLKGIKKQRVFSHFAGKSNHKGTGAIVAASKCRKLPLLNLYLTPNEGQQKYYVNNTDVILHTQRIPDDKFRQLQNSSMFHLCPSEYEGWGHYINEAKSIGAIIITTNAAPMNELVTSSFGFGAAYDTVTKHHLAPTYKANPESIAECILLAAEMSDSVAKKLSRKSREDYLNNDKQFKEVFINQVNLLLN
jgi:hypothetical protein